MSRKDGRVFYSAEDLERIAQRQVSRRQLLGLGAGVVLGGSLLAACGGGDDDGGEATTEPADTGAPPADTSAPADTGGAAGGNVGEGQTIGLVLNGTNPYTQCLVTGILEELKGTGYGFVGVQGDFDSQKEVENFDALIAQGVSGILVLPNTSESAARGTLAADDAGIPVVNLAWAKQSPADDVYVARIRIDNIRGGNMIAEWIGENTEPSEIGLITGVEGNEFSEQLSEGIIAGVEALGGGWTIVEEQAGNWVRDPAIALTEDYLTAHPDLGIIVTYATGMGNGVASYLEREGLTDIVHISSDGDPEALDWLEKGLITALRYYSSAQEGRLGVVLMRDYLENGTRQEIVDLDMAMVTADDVESVISESPDPPNGLGPVCYEEFLSEAEKVA
jgi:ABC-type sugar transport system substrate-binding protein